MTSGNQKGHLELWVIWQNFKKEIVVDIVNFADQTWQEIPEQDNPAMVDNTYNGGHARPEECIMIFKGTHARITGGGIVVAYVPIDGDIIKKGVFWTLENAKAFAYLLAATTGIENDGGDW